jgi:hypothetical protein
MLQIGDFVMYEGRVHVLVGITPMSVTPFEMQLQDRATGRTFWTEGRPRRRPEGLYEVLKDAAAGFGSNKAAQPPNDPES